MSYITFDKQVFISLANCSPRLIKGKGRVVFGSGFVDVIVDGKTRARIDKNEFVMVEVDNG